MSGPLCCRHRCTHARTHTWTQKCWVTICECWISWPVLSWQAVQTKRPICPLMVRTKRMTSTASLLFLISVLIFFTLLSFCLSYLIHIKSLFLFPAILLLLCPWPDWRFTGNLPPLLSWNASVLNFVKSVIFGTSPSGLSHRNEQRDWHTIQGACQQRWEVRGQREVNSPVLKPPVVDWVTLAHWPPDQSAGVLFLWTKC